MPGLLSEIKSLFDKSDLYDVLNIGKTSSSAEIKKAYYKISLTVHPDKCEEKEREDATKRFQILGKIYSILSNKNLRTVYDETGSLDEDDLVISQDTDWYEYWKRCFPKISSQDIDKFVSYYKNSDEEKNDVIKLYKKYKGDMGKIMDGLMCAEVHEEPRLRGIIRKLIDDGELEDFDRFSNEAPKRKRARLARYKEEKEELEEMMEELKRKNNIKDGEDSLTSLILKNKQKSSNFLDAMEQKYAKTSQPPKRGKTGTSKKK